MAKVYLISLALHATKAPDGITSAVFSFESARKQRVSRLPEGFDGLAQVLRVSWEQERKDVLMSERLVKQTNAMICDPLMLLWFLGLEIIGSECRTKAASTLSPVGVALKPSLLETMRRLHATFVTSEPRLASPSL